MAPKNKFTKQQLIDIGFDIAKEEGFGNITIRKIADRLGSSIAPIYGNYKDVEELKRDVMKKVTAVFQELVAKQKIENAFLNLGVASAVFAKEYPLLYEDILLRNTAGFSHLMDMKPYVLEQMKREERLLKLDDAELELLLIKMHAFQIGLSVLARDKSYSDILTEVKMIEMLNDMGNLVIIESAAHRGKNQFNQSKEE